MTRDGNPRTETYPTVRSFCELLTRITGVEPVCTITDPTTMTLTHENDRVKMVTILGRKVGSRRWFEKSVILTENGENRSLAWSVEHYAAVFTGREAEFLESRKTVLPPLEEIPADHALPLMVQATYDKLCTQVSGFPEVVTSYGMEGERYALQYEGPTATVRLYFEAKGSSPSPLRMSRADHRDPIRVVDAEGMDITEEVLADPTVYAQVISGDTSRIGDVKPRMMINTRGSRSNAVENRRGSVIRV